MMLLEFLDMIPPRIVGGDKFTWNCYGEDARYLDLESNVSLVFDEKTQEIYELSIMDANITWRHPEYKQAYNKEMKERRNMSRVSIKMLVNKSNEPNLTTVIEKVNKKYEQSLY